MQTKYLYRSERTVSTFHRGRSGRSELRRLSLLGCLLTLRGRLCPIATLDCGREAVSWLPSVRLHCQHLELLAGFPRAELRHPGYPKAGTLNR